MTDEADLHAEVEALIDHAVVSAAEAALAAAEARAAAERRRAAEADVATRQARAALPALIDGAAAGEAFEDGAIIAAHRAVADGEAVGTFRSAVARRVEGMAGEAREALADARDRACQPVLQRAIDYYVLAGQKADKAVARSKWGMSTSPTEKDRLVEVRRVAMAAAKVDFDRGNALIDLGARNGLRIPRYPGYAIPMWPVTESFMRLYWRRPYAEEADHAA